MIKLLIQPTFILALVVGIQGGIRYDVKELSIYRRKTYQEPLIFKICKSNGRYLHMVLWETKQEHLTHKGNGNQDGF